MLQQMYNIEVSQSILHFSVIITSYKTDSRTRGQESEERNHNLFSTLICLFYVHLCDVIFDFYEI
jgi:hypothetical protein